MNGKRADLEDIRALIDRYAILGDVGRVDELAGLFTLDGVLETGTWRCDGRTAIRERLAGEGQPGDPGLTFMRHHVTSCDLVLNEEATASGRTYFLLITNVGLDRAGTYVDAFRREDGWWRFSHRAVRMDWISDRSLMPAQPTRHPRVDA